MHPGQRSAAASSVPSACLDHASRDVASVLEESEAGGRRRRKGRAGATHLERERGRRG